MDASHYEFVHAPSSGTVAQMIFHTHHMNNNTFHYVYVYVPANSSASLTLSGTHHMNYDAVFVYVAVKISGS
jgi:hypothetical protein